MSQPEAILSAAIRIRWGKDAPHVRMFRNSSGLFWSGRVKSRNNGVVLLENAQQVHAGLAKGAADAIGWTTVTITPEMVGRKIALFTSAEFKTPGSNRPPVEQTNWRDAVLAAGGLAAFVHSEDEAMALVQAP